MWEQVGEDKGRWTEYVDSQTGQSSIKEHKLKLVWKSCKPDGHYYELTANREVTCKKCGAIKPFVLGQVTLLKGKLIPIK
jgi:hypothetical protein